MTRSVLCVAVVSLVAAAAFADGLPDSVGVDAPNGSVLTTEITADDVDDFVFAGLPGVALKVTAKAPKGSALLPLLTVLRPDGSLVTEDDGLVRGGRSNAPAASFVLDATGIWKVRVSGANASTGAYSVAVKMGKVPKRTIRLSAPDGNGQFRFGVPAIGDATVGYTLRSTGAAPAFNSFTDPTGAPVANFPGGTRVRKFVLPESLPLGDYTLAFDAPPGAAGATLSLTVVPKRPKKRVVKLAPVEPSIAPGAISPTAGGPGVVVTVQVNGLVDPAAPAGAVRLALGHVALTQLVLSVDGRAVSGTIPAGIAIGVYDVVVASTSGQIALRAGAFEIVPPPVITRLDPTVGPASGDFPVTISGRNFRAGQMAVVFDATQLPLLPTVLDANTLQFTAPGHAAMVVRVRVRDVGSRQDSGFALLEYVTAPAIGSVKPPLVPALGGETVTLEGAFFSATDKVFLETTVAGTFEEITATQGPTWQDFSHHRFVAPPRPTGTYEVYVEDELGRPDPRRTKTVSYYSFADVTAQSGLPGRPDAWDAWTSALGDFDSDGDADLFLARRGGDAPSGVSLTRVLANDGAGRFTDVTAAVMPPAGSDDWRADRIAATDVDGDGRADLVLTTNSTVAPPAGRSHTRILLNEARGGTGPGAAERVFRDRTIEVLPPPRSMTKYATGVSYVSDDWRGLDLWIGDVDRDGAAHPEILVTHDETKDDPEVRCGAYCAAVVGSNPYSYGMYWGGSRAFTWDKAARGGLGRYRFDSNFFPRRSGSTVPTAVPGPLIPICSASYNVICKGAFTPFTGKRLAVGDLDGDGKPDVAVLSDTIVERRPAPSAPLAPISSLQVALQGFNPLDGAKVTDITPKLTALGLDLRGDAIAIGATGFPDGNRFGSILWAKAAPAGAGTLKLFRFDGTGATTVVSDVTSTALPAFDANDPLQATSIAFVDVDSDSDSDVVLVANSAPGAGRPAFRVLRNETQGATQGLLRRSLDGLVPASSDPFDAQALSVGDVTGDGYADFVLSRANAAGGSSQTRVLVTDK